MNKQEIVKPMRVIASVCSPIAMFCTQMAIYTGNYSTSEKWGYIALSFGICGAFNWLIWAAANS